MSVKIGSNIASLQAQRRLGEASTSLSQTYERLSSGQRINKAADDSAGLAIAFSLNFDSRVFTQAIRNVNDGISALNIAEAGIEQLSNITIRQKELAEQAANGTFSAAQRAALDREASELTDEYNRILDTTKFNGISLFQDSTTNISIQAGRGTSAVLDFSIGSSLSGVGQDTAEVSTIGLNGLQSFEFFDLQIMSDYDGSGFDLNFTGNILLDGENLGFDLDNSYNTGGDIIIDLDGYLSADGVASAIVGQYASSLYSASLVDTDTVRFTALTTGNKTNPINYGTNANISTTNGTSISEGAYFTFATPDGSGGSNNYYAYFTSTPGLNDPALGGGYTGIEINTNLSIATNEDLASSASSAINSALGSSVLASYSSTTLTITNLISGAASDVTRGTLAGTSSANVSTQGSTSGSIRASSIDLTSASSALTALSPLEVRLQNINQELGRQGAFQSRLQVAQKTLEASRENYLTAAGRITDADIASESAKLVQTQILQSSATAILSQANQQPALAISLIRQI